MVQFIGQMLDAGFHLNHFLHRFLHLLEILVSEFFALLQLLFRFVENALAATNTNERKTCGTRAE